MRRSADLVQLVTGAATTGPHDILTVPAAISLEASLERRRFSQRSFISN